MNKLAYVGKIINVENIENADRLSLATVVCGNGGKWHGVVQKGQFEQGDTCVVFLQDAIVPQVPELSFMERYHWRVRMQRLRGAPSECLIVTPGSVDISSCEIGEDVTQLLKVTKYEKPIDKSIAGDVYGNFPSFIPKTDEPNFQSVPHLVDALRGKPFVATVKYDGSSATVYHRDGHIGACSRNLELKDTPNSAIWGIVHEYNLDEILPRYGNIAIQFEVCGPNIQGNPLELEKVQPFLFDVYDIDLCSYVDYERMASFAFSNDFPLARMAFSGIRFRYDSEELQKLAEGEYDNGKQREGLVFRSVYHEEVTGDRLSFKVINLRYKD